MKLRTDLLAKLTPEMMRAGIEANTHRYQPEPRFSKTGVGSLSATSTEERANEAERSTAIRQMVTSEPAKPGNRSGAKI